MRSSLGTPFDRQASRTPAPHTPEALDTKTCPIMFFHTSRAPPLYMFSRAIPNPPAFDTGSSKPIHTSTSLTSRQAPGEGSHSSNELLGRRSRMKTIPPLSTGMNARYTVGRRNKSCFPRCLRACISTPGLARLKLVDTRQTTDRPGPKVRKIVYLQYGDVLTTRKARPERIFRTHHHLSLFDNRTCARLTAPRKQDEVVCGNVMHRVEFDRWRLELEQA
ncbi:hypothetical protein FA95DRAFT_1201667 [Auriscalpium vulgare]|uniref:Uncharacterized protein n=1 Tax=Auriscalpium vulgare TaxID=40419 RepID=A0ACB8R4T6_9AGAM|nr:hypothetical protein FA95DRAFT_1201667 [Auriscalpium vulgare]